MKLKDLKQRDLCEFILNGGFGFEKTYECARYVRITNGLRKLTVWKLPENSGDYMYTEWSKGKTDSVIGFLMDVMGLNLNEIKSKYCFKEEGTGSLQGGQQIKIPF